MAVCSKCGKEQYYEERFCYSCGAPVFAEGESNIPAASTPAKIENTEIYPYVRKITLKLSVCLMTGMVIFLLWLLLARDIFVSALTIGILLWVIPYSVFFLIFRLVLLKKVHLTGKQYRNIRKEMKKSSSSVFRKTS